MKKFKKETKEVLIFDTVFCDVCKNEILGTGEQQEVISLSFSGGFSSVFGDGSNVDIDICQDCFQEKLGKYCRINEEYSWS